MGQDVFSFKEKYGVNATTLRAPALTGVGLPADPILSLNSWKNILDNNTLYIHRCLKVSCTIRRGSLQSSLIFPFCFY